MLRVCASDKGGGEGMWTRELSGAVGVGGVCSGGRQMCVGEGAGGAGGGVGSV